MVLTVATVAQWAGLALGDHDGGSSQLSAVDVANHAGDHLVNSHPWAWLRGQPVTIDLRADVAITTGAADGNSGRYISISASEIKDNYTFVVGDYFTVKTIDGTAVDHVNYPIIEKGNSQITLASTVDTTALLGKSVTGTIDCRRLALPSDFKNISPHSAIYDSESIIPGLQLVTMDEVLRRRTWRSQGTTYYGAIATSQAIRDTDLRPTGVQDGDATIIHYPTQVIELDRSASANEANAFTMSYKRGFQRVNDDNDDIMIPDWLEACYVQLYSHFVQGYLEKDEMPMAQRLAEWWVDPITKAARQRDGSAQPSYGLMRGGAAQRNFKYGLPSENYSVNGPA